MKALTIPQPWATLTALGVRTIETRSWPCPPSLIGQPLAIHAGAGTGGIDSICAGSEAGWRYCYLGDEGEFQASYCYLTSDEGTRGQTMLTGPGISIPDEYGVMPLGAVVATCRVAACLPIDGHADDRCRATGAQHIVTTGVELFRCSGERGALNVSDQLPYGDFRPGRYAWLLEDVKPTTERCPACWGRWPEAMPGVCIDIDGGWWHQPGSCRHCTPLCAVCGGATRCPPVPARGRQRVWTWEDR